MKKGQVQAISMVLIAGIIISLAGAAYFWGKPTLDKRSTITDVNSAKSFIVQLDDYITEVARSGGSKSLSVPQITQTSSIRVDEEANEIVMKFFVSQPILELGDEGNAMPVETFDQSDPGPYGGSPRIITLESSEDGDMYLMTLRLKYRELDDNIDKKGYKIEVRDVTPEDEGGNSVISVSYGGKETRTGAEGAANGGDLYVTLINVRLA